MGQGPARGWPWLRHKVHSQPLRLGSRETEQSWREMETWGAVWAQDFEHTEFKGKGYGGGGSPGAEKKD